MMHFASSHNTCNIFIAIIDGIYVFVAWHAKTVQMYRHCNKCSNHRTDLEVMHTQLAQFARAFLDNVNAFAIRIEVNAWCPLRATETLSAVYYAAFGCTTGSIYSAHLWMQSRCPCINLYIIMYMNALCKYKIHTFYSFDGNCDIHHISIRIIQHAFKHLTKCTCK